jgi:hypothetical protein
MHEPLEQATAGGAAEIIAGADAKPAEITTAQNLRLIGKSFALGTVRDSVLLSVGIGRSVARFPFSFPRSP